MTKVYILTRTDSAKIGPSSFQVVNVYLDKNKAEAERNSLLNTGKTTTRNLQTYLICETEIIE